MDEYILLIQGDGNYNFTPEEIALRVERYTVWMQEQMDKGQYVWGQPLKSQGIHLKSRENLVTDGPFLEPKEMIGGIIIVRARSLDEAKQMALACPLLDHFQIYVRPVDSVM